MKTITEFNVLDLKTALVTFEKLSKENKTAEEITAAIGEMTKREGDKLKLFVNALESIRNRTQGLKRVVVLSVTEKDKVPSHAEKREEHVYLPEYYPSLEIEKKNKGRGRPGDDRGRGKGKGKGKGRGGRGGGLDAPGGDKQGRSGGGGGLGGKLGGGGPGGGGFGGGRRPRRPRTDVVKPVAGPKPTPSLKVIVAPKIVAPKIVPVLQQNSPDETKKDSTT